VGYVRESRAKDNEQSSPRLLITPLQPLCGDVIADHFWNETHLVGDAHFFAKVAEAGISAEVCEDRMRLYREGPDVSLGCFVEGLEGFVDLAERSVNEDL